MSKFIVGDKMLQALYDAGVLDDDYESVCRILIDIKVAEPAMLYIEKYGDSVLYDVVLNGGIQVVETAEAARPTGATPRPTHETEAA